MDNNILKNKVYNNFKEILSQIKLLSKTSDHVFYFALCEQYYQLVVTTDESFRSIPMIQLLMNETQQIIDELACTMIGKMVETEGSYKTNNEFNNESDKNKKNYSLNKEFNF